MADERIRLDVQERAARGTRATRRLRREGVVPGVLYGPSLPARAISVAERDLRRALTGHAGLNAILDVVVEGESKPHAAILKAYQQHPVRGNVEHVDLQEVRLDRPIQSAVPVELVGDSAGVREGGVLQQALREVTVEALPMEMPDSIQVDVSQLGVGDSVRVGDLPALERGAVVDDPDAVVASVTPPTPVAAPEDLQEGEEPSGAVEPDGAPLEPGADAAGGEGTVPG